MSFLFRASIGRRMAVGLGTLVLVLLAVGIFSVRAERHLVLARERSDHARAIIEEIERVHYLVHEAEADQRNYLLTEDPHYLEPLKTARRELPAAIENLRRLNGDDPWALHETDHFEIIAWDRVERLEARVETARAQGFAAAAELLRQGAGARAMTDFHDLVRTMERHQSERAGSRLADAQSRARASVLASEAAVIVGILLMALVSVLLARSVTVPVRKLVDGVRRIGDGDLDHRIDLARADELGTLAGAIGEMASKRKGAEDELRRAEARLQTLLATLPIGVVIADESGRIVQSNAAAERIWRRVPHVGMEQYGEFEAHRLDGRRLAGEDWALARAITGGETVLGEVVRIVDFEGTSKIILNSGAPLRDEDGRIFGAVNAIEDISELARLQDEQRFLADAGIALAASLDQEATLQRIAELAVPQLADWCSVDLVDGDKIRPLAITHRGTSALVRTEQMRRAFPADAVPDHPVARAVANGEAVLAPRFDALIDGFAREPSYRKDVEALGLHSYMVVPLRGRDRTLGAISFATAGAGARTFGPASLALAEELARRASLAIENARLFREAQLATQLREEVLAVVSHDLKNPLNVISIHCQLLQRMVAKHADPSLDEAIVAIRQATTRADRMVHDLLDLAALRAGSLRITRAPTSAAAIVAEAVSDMGPLAAEKGHALEGEAAPDLPEVSCDRDRVLQILGNLVGNAIKATPAGGVIEVHVERVDGEAVFSVRDTGPGIAPNEAPHLFERFWRGRDSKYKGTGLGLAISRGLVEAHGGRIWVESAPAAGSTFRFSLPLAATST